MGGMSRAPAAPGYGGAAKPAYGYDDPVSSRSGPAFLSNAMNGVNPMNGAMSAAMQMMQSRQQQPMRQGGPMQSPSLYGPQQGGMSSMIAALRGNAPRAQMNPGVQFMQNQANAPTTPMNSYNNGQNMVRQIAQQQSQMPQPQMQQNLPKGQAGPIPGFGGPKGQAGPIPQESIGLPPAQPLMQQRPPISPTGMTFSPQRTQLTVAPPQPVVAPVVANMRGRGTPQRVEQFDWNMN
ncbi:hypothetical protein UFOVP601_11 [uncultured Caudovirales phage]|uniref:Uncharacterized protein n=1 Tax=uncultured Caudovirales phage TaxID=2100421 RepID=A0A6J5MZS4_9CAUD|nr:hypothetical protein UFOVP601_11 [uncultured Caudovirales phage]